MQFRYHRALLTFAALTATLSIGASTAAAERWLAISPAEGITATSEGKLSFTAGRTTVACNVTLTGSFEEAVIETARDHLGEIAGLRAANCTGGELEVSQRLPWALGYSSILGTLPRSLTGLLFLAGAQLSFSRLGEFSRCIYSGSIGALLALSGANPYRSGAIRLLGTEMALLEGRGCPTPGRLTGTLVLSANQEFTAAEEALNTYTTVPAEASEAGTRINFGQVHVNTTSTIEFRITAVTGTWRFGACAIADFTYFNFNETDAGVACNRIIESVNRPMRTVRLIFSPGPTANQVRTTTFTLPPIGNITVRGQSIP